MSIKYGRFVWGMAVAACVASPFVTLMIQRREYVGEFPKRGFNQNRVEYPKYEYVPTSPPVTATVPEIDVDAAVQAPIRLDDLPAVNGFGRLDFSGNFVSTKKMQADVLLTATILLPPENGNPPQTISSTVQVLTPHKHRSFDLKLPIPDRKGTFRLRIDLVSPDLAPMQNVVAEGKVEIH